MRNEEEENQKNKKEKIICESEFSIVISSLLGLKTTKKYFFYLTKENKEYFLKYEKSKGSNKFINKYKIENNTTINFDFDIKKKKFIFFVILNEFINLELTSNDLKESEIWKKSFEKCKISIKARVKTKNFSTQNTTRSGLKLPESISLWNSSNVSEDDSANHSFEEFIELHRKNI